MGLRSSYLLPMYFVVWSIFLYIGDFYLILRAKWNCFSAEKFWESVHFGLLRFLSKWEALRFSFLALHQSPELNFFYSLCEIDYYLHTSLSHIYLFDFPVRFIFTGSSTSYYVNEFSNGLKVIFFVLAKI